MQYTQDSDGFVVQIFLLYIRLSLRLEAVAAKDVAETAVVIGTAEAIKQRR